eukprot:2136190-Rhodomonas_salina.1
MEEEKGSSTDREHRMLIGCVRAGRSDLKSPFDAGGHVVLCASLQQQQRQPTAAVTSLSHRPHGKASLSPSSALLALALNVPPPQSLQKPWLMTQKRSMLTQHCGLFDIIP